MKFRFTTFNTVDHLDLQGLLYEPEQYTNKVAIFLHGNGGSDIFRKREEYEAYAKILTKDGIACSFFNNRGAGFITRYTYNRPSGDKEHLYYGTTFELIEESIADIDAAIKELKEYGYSEFYLIGHSSGANKAVVYNYMKPKNEISKFILAEGGDDTGLFYDALGKERFEKYLDIAKEKIMNEHENELVPETIFGMWLSWKSLYDIINPNGLCNIFSFHEAKHQTDIGRTKQIFGELNSMPAEKTHFIYAHEDGFSDVTGEEKMELINKNLDYEAKYRIISDTDHGFTGKEEEYVDLISMMLRASD